MSYTYPPWAQRTPEVQAVLDAVASHQASVAFPPWAERTPAMRAIIDAVAQGSRTVALPPWVERTPELLALIADVAGAQVSLGTPTSAPIGATQTTLMGDDAFTWPDGRPLDVDQYGNLFGLIEDGGGNHWWLWRNVGGAWTVGAQSYPSLTRGTVGYDKGNNLAHVCWSTTQANGGIVYRRYVMAYNGAHQITGITEDTGATIGGVVQARTNVVLDDGTAIAEYEHPGCIFMQDAAYGSLGAILCFWGCRVTGVGNEARASMLVFGSTGARAQTLANWAAPVAADTTSLGANSAPSVAYSKIFASANGAEVAHVAGQRKAAGTHANDLYFWVNNGVLSTPSILYRRAQWNAGASNWSTGLTTAATLTAIVRAGANSTTGYSSGGTRQQLITRPTESVSGDCMFGGVMTYKDDISRDTWTIWKVDSADVITTADVYSAGAGTTTASGPWGDLAYDNGKDQLIVSYVKSDRFVYLETRKASDLSVINTAIQAFSTVSGVDIPCLVEGGSAAGTIWMVFRDTVAGQRNGYAISVPWQ